MSLSETITLSAEDLQQHAWSQDGLHFGHPLSPLFASYMVPAMTEGTRLAMGTLKAPVRQFIGKIYESYYYQAVVPAAGDPQTIMEAHHQVVAPLMGKQRAKLQETVETDLMPLHAEIDRLTESVHTAADAIRALGRLEAIYRRFWELHFLIVLPRAVAGVAFEAAYQAAFPASDPLKIYDLVLGTMNKSLEQDRALWQLTALAKDSPAVLRALEAERVYPALQADVRTEPFRQALAQYLDTYGWRTMYCHEFLYETWRENPEYCLTVMKGYLRRDFDFDRHWHDVVETREQRVQAMLSAVDDPELRQRLAASHQNALDAWPIDEDHHFYIDAMLPARARQLCLKVGDVLLRAGPLVRRDDVFFFYLDELMAALEGGIPVNLDVLTERRHTLERQFAETPAPGLGQASDPSQTPDLISARIFGAGSPSLEGATKEVRGYAASPGRYVGPVRVVQGPDEFFKVQPGDILVCRNTAPSWTGLFATCGAVITETGGILSHAATVAREYKIPCVVGTREATRVFHDGDIVAVDGTRGTAVVNG